MLHFQKKKKLNCTTIPALLCLCTKNYFHLFFSQICFNFDQILNRPFCQCHGKLTWQHRIQNKKSKLLYSSSYAKFSKGSVAVGWTRSSWLFCSSRHRAGSGTNTRVLLAATFSEHNRGQQVGLRVNALFDTIHGSHCFILASFYFYLQYFQQKNFNFNKISRSWTDS